MIDSSNHQDIHYYDKDENNPQAAALKMRLAYYSIYSELLLKIQL